MFPPFYWWEIRPTGANLTLSRAFAGIKVNLILKFLLFLVPCRLLKGRDLSLKEGCVFWWKAGTCVRGVVRSRAWGGTPGPGGPTFHLTSHRAWHITNGSQIFPEKSSFQFLCFSIMKCDPLERKALSWLIFSSKIFRLLVYWSWRNKFKSFNWRAHCLDDHRKLCSFPCLWAGHGGGHVTEFPPLPFLSCFFFYWRVWS